MHTKSYFFLFFISSLFFSTTASSQTINFDETWKEFLVNDKISNMSTLVRPDKAYRIENYAKYLLMNMNTDFCQSDMEEAEKLMAELKTIDPQVPRSIPRFVEKMDNLEKKIKAYHSMDEIWNKFLKTKQVSLEELDAIKAAKTSCEKRTLAKYSYMTAYNYFCQGNIARSKDIFENRTLRLAEKTSLRVEDVEGLAEEVRKMKTLYQNMDKLDAAWNDYIKTGVSSGFDMELPIFDCNPTPNMKEYVLRGAVDICNLAPEMFEKIKALEKETGIKPQGNLRDKVKELKGNIDETDNNLANLNKAWKAFIPENKMIFRDYGYEFCTTEPLVKAYIMDGFSFVCEMAEESLQKIEGLVKSENLDLDKVTLAKINELHELNQEYQDNGVEIEKTWSKFTSQGDTLYKPYYSSEIYCDNIHQVKDWMIMGYCGTCEERAQYLDKIDEFQATFEFNFMEDVECRIQNLRVKLWDCRYQILKELAGIEVMTTTYEANLDGLMVEYEMGERPESCDTEN